ncbi:MAG: PaaI family thioesterase [Polyangiales bacterium]
MPRMNREALEHFIEHEFPQAHGFSQIVALGDESIELRLPFRDAHLRPGGTLSGPALMTLADTGGYYLILSILGPVVHAVTTSLNINFMRKPRPEDVLAVARVLKLGRQLAVVEVSMRSASSPELVAQATVTYSLPPATQTTSVP